jgi:hypothetical protein
MEQVVNKRDLRLIGILFAAFIVILVILRIIDPNFTFLNSIVNG